MEMYFTNLNQKHFKGVPKMFLSLLVLLLLSTKTFAQFNEITVTSCPSDITVQATSPLGAYVSWDEPTATIDSPCGIDISFANIPGSVPNGGLFPPGTTQILYQIFATGGVGNGCGASTVCTFNVIVEGYEIINGTHYIESRANGQSAASKTSNVYMAPPNAYQAQKWIFTHVGDGRHLIKNKKTGKYLKVNQFKCENGANINTGNGSDGDNKKWVITKQGNDYYLRPAHCFTHAMDKGQGQMDPLN